MALFIFRDPPSPQINVDRLVRILVIVSDVKTTLTWGRGGEGEDKVHFSAKQ